MERRVHQAPINWDSLIGTNTTQHNTQKMQPGTRNKTNLIHDLLAQLATQVLGPAVCDMWGFTVNFG